MQGRARVDALRSVLDQVGVSGEVDFVRHVPGEHRLIVPVRLPTRDAVVSLDYKRRSATISSREHSLGDALVYCTRCPDRTTSTCVGTRLSCAGGDFLLTPPCTDALHHRHRHLWVALKAERRVGLALVLAGAITFWGLVYAIAA